MSGQQPPPDPWRPPADPGGPQQPPGAPPQPPYGPPPGYAQPPAYGAPPAYGQPPYPPQQPPPPGWSAYPPQQPGWSAYPPQQPGWYAPAGTGWSAPPRPRREPPTALYALPALLLLGAVAALTYFFATRSDELRIADQSEKVGRTDTGVSVLARPGWHYDIYLPDTDESPRVGACTFTTDAPINGSVVVDETTSGDAYFTDDAHRDWVQVGTVTAPDGVSGQSRLTCTGFSGLMNVSADDSMFGWMFLVIAVSGIAFVLGVGVLVLLLLLRARARRAPVAPPAAPGYGYAGW